MLSSFLRCGAWCDYDAPQFRTYSSSISGLSFLLRRLVASDTATMPAPVRARYALTGAILFPGVSYGN